MRRLLMALALWLACLPVVPASAAQLLVIIDAEGAGAALKPGNMVDAETIVSLPAGARLALLSENGRMVTLEGPYEGKADNQGLADGDPEASTVLTKLSKLIVGQDSIIETGASRSLSGESGDQQPHLAYLSVMSSGERCALNERPELWRADADRSESVTLVDRQGNNASMTWAAGSDRIDLPAQFVADGAKIIAVIENRQVELSLHRRPPIVRNTTEIFHWLVDRGCKEQSIAMLQALRRKAARN